MNTVCLWSGGKDSAYAFYLARTAGQHIKALISFLDEEGAVSRSHGLSAEVIALQAEATGMPHLSRAMSQRNFEGDFKDWIALLKKEIGLEAMIFGDIHLQEHKQWIERVCRETEILPLLPLWGRNPKGLAEEILASGFKAVVVSTRADVLGEEWLGKPYDPSFLETLPPGTDPLGEKGEFHTFVYDGPIFQRPFHFHPGEKRQKEGHWFLEIVLDGGSAGDEP
jgi:diphthine-ammonia ligase